MECSNYDVCILCFTGGKEANAHKRSHSYRVLVGYCCNLLGYAKSWR